MGPVESGFWLKEPVAPGLRPPTPTATPRSMVEPMDVEAPATTPVEPMDVEAPATTPATPTATPGFVACKEPMVVEAPATRPATTTATPGNEKLVPAQCGGGTVAEPGYLGSYFIS